MQDAGGDPYTAIPEDRRWSGLRDETWDRVSTKDKPSAYGPLQESVHLWTYRLASRLSPDPSTQVWLFKIPAALADLATGMAAVSLLAALGMSRRRALVYLWSPLSVTEFWIEGHYDSIALAFVVAALALSARGRVNWALGLLSAGIMAKFWPVVLAPFLLVSRAGRRWRFEWTGMAAAAGVAILLCLPYWGQRAPRSGRPDRAHGRLAQQRQPVRAPGAPVRREPGSGGDDREMAAREWRPADSQHPAAGHGRRIGGAVSDAAARGELLSLVLDLDASLACRAHRAGPAAMDRVGLAGLPCRAHVRGQRDLGLRRLPDGGRVPARSRAARRQVASVDRAPPKAPTGAATGAGCCPG